MRRALRDPLVLGLEARGKGRRIDGGEGGGPAGGVEVVGGGRGRGGGAGVVVACWRRVSWVGDVRSGHDNGVEERGDMVISSANGEEIRTRWDSNPCVEVMLVKQVKYEE